MTRSQDINRATIGGEITKSPVAHETHTGKIVVRFQTTTRSYRNDIVFEQRHTVTTWGDDAKWALENLREGQRIFVEGEMRTRSYPTADGQKRFAFEVVAFPISHGGIVIMSNE